MKKLKSMFATLLIVLVGCSNSNEISSVKQSGEISISNDTSFNTDSEVSKVCFNDFIKDVFYYDINQEILTGITTNSLNEIDFLTQYTVYNFNVIDNNFEVEYDSGIFKYKTTESGFYLYPTATSNKVELVFKKDNYEFKYEFEIKEPTIKTLNLIKAKEDGLYYSYNQYAPFTIEGDKNVVSSDMNIMPGDTIKFSYYGYLMCQDIYPQNFVISYGKLISAEVISRADYLNFNIENGEAIGTTNQNYYFIRLIKDFYSWGVTDALYEEFAYDENGNMILLSDLEDGTVIYGAYCHYNNYDYPWIFAYYTYKPITNKNSD